MFAGFGEGCRHDPAVCVNNRSLVCAFYDLTFSFREFLDEYPHLHSSIVDTLVGNVFNDLNPLYEALGKFAKRETRAEISTTTA